MSRPLTVALYSGIVVRHDAVSESLRIKLGILRDLADRGAPVEPVVFTYASEDDLPGLRPVANVARLLGLQQFWSADMHVFEFGMHYDLVDALFVIPPDRPSLVIDHNTTPPELVELPEVKAGCQLALLQRHNLREATHVACVSEFTLDLVRSVGVEDDRLSVLHLPPAHPGVLRPRSFGGDEGPRPVQVLFVGRLVHAKGVLDLLEASEDLRADGRIAVRLVGSPRFSDPDVLLNVERAVEEGGGNLGLSADVAPGEMVRLYAQSDLLVIPSYHEGYCVPVVEALSAGCHVISYDGSNLPNVGGGLGQLVATGSVTGLRDALARFVERAEESGRADRPMIVPTVSGDLEEDEWLERVRAHLADYSQAAFERRFLGLVRTLAERSPAGLSTPMAAIIDERRGELAAA